MNYYPDFAKFLDQYLSLHDRSGAWLAQRIGVNPATVSRWRNGQTRPDTPEMVIGIADILGIHGDERTRLLRSVRYGIVEQHGVLARRAGEIPQKEQAEDAYRSTPSPWSDYPATYRRAEMVRLAHWSEIGASGIVLGLAGSGVSTLLRYFANHPDRLSSYLSASRRTIMPVWIEMQPLAEPVPATLYRLFLRGLLETAPHLPSRLPPDLRQACQAHLNNTDTFVLQTTLFAVLAHYQADQVTLVFVLDRVDQFAGNVQLTLGNPLRSLRDHFRETVTYLLGMRITPTYLDTIDALGDLGRLLSTHLCVVGSLTTQDSEFVIAKRAQAAARKPTAADIQQFLALSGGYPTLLKAVVRWWLTYTSQLPDAAWDKALLQEPGIQLRLREIGRGLSVQEQQALQAVVTSYGANAIPDAIGERLVQLGICRQHSQGWQLAGTLFAGMV